MARVTGPRESAGPAHPAGAAADAAALGARAAADRIAGGSLTVYQLAAACLARVAAREGELHAWAYLDRERVLQRASTIDDAGARQPLCGVPVAVKDIMDTADMPTEYGSPIYRGHQPRTDAACVARLRAAGGLVLGKSATTEFAHTHPAATRNPHHPDHTPGGSSSGSAAAVSAHMVPLALGTQTAGSVIRPATFCGVHAYKPSYGAIPVAGTRPLAPSLDTIGMFARSVSDLCWFAAALLDQPVAAELAAAAESPESPGAPASPAAVSRAATPPAGAGGPPRVGLMRTHHWHEVDAGAQAVVEAAYERLRRSGAGGRELETPAWFAPLDDTHAVIMDRETADSLYFERQEHPDQLSVEITNAMVRGLAINEARYRWALQQAFAARRRARALFAEVDLILTPSAPGAAPGTLTSTGCAAFNRIWTLLGTPCITLPAGTNGGGLPLGVQLTAAYGDDARLLAAANWADAVLR